MTDISFSHYKKNSLLFNIHSTEKTTGVAFLSFWHISYCIISSPTPKVQVSFLIEICPLSFVVVVVVVVNFSHFHLLLQNHWTNFNQTWPKASLGEGNSSLLKWREYVFSKGIDNKWTKKLRNFKIVFSRTTGPISTKLHKASLVYGDLSFYISLKNKNLIFLSISIAFRKCAYWLELFLRWAMWPMGFLLILFPAP